MEKVCFCSDNVKKEIYLDQGAFVGAFYENSFTTGRTNVKEEFVLFWRERKGRRRALYSSQCEVSRLDDGLAFVSGDFRITEKYTARPGGELIKELFLRAPGEIFVEEVRVEELTVEKDAYRWSAPLAGKTFIPAKVARLGQPVFLKDMFFGQETPVGDNGIRSGKASFRYHTGRLMSELSENGEYRMRPFVAGAARAEGEQHVSDAFFSYLDGVKRKAVFRVQYNSWYDNKLDITSERIKKSFTAIAEGFARAGFRALDCYVVDDGWTEYEKPLFWEFNSKFRGGFAKEAELTRELGAEFGVWFGPRGGYTAQTYRYAKLLEQAGYHVNKRSRDICTADSEYVAAMCSRMAEFCKSYNVGYFKIDGFAYAPCRESGHNHPPAKGDGIAFYTYLWEEWLKGFESIRAVRPDVCLNVTSYAHCSPWFLLWADFIWMNNASDMDFVGKGSDMQRCLNYRDGRYRDLFVKRQYRFPAAHLYNHEPTYARRNYASMKDREVDKPITYTDEEFSLYMKCCLMRGSGLAELYFSPEMMTEEKWKAAARELEFAEKNFSVLSRSRFFGGRPEKGEVYGYIAANGGKYVLMLRNPGSKARRYSFDLPVVGHVEGNLEGQEIRFSDNLD